MSDDVKNIDYVGMLARKHNPQDGNTVSADTLRRAIREAYETGREHTKAIIKKHIASL